MGKIQPPWGVGQTRPLRRGLMVIVCGAGMLIGGCGIGDMQDLESHVETVLARPGKDIDPPPEIKPYDAYAYQSSLSVDPFEPLFQEVPEPEPEPEVTGLQPDRDRNKEELEEFTLDSLRMVGTLVQNEQTWGLVVNPDGTVYRVRVGNYMGKNHGKILNVLEDRIELMEIVQRPQGGWEEREAALALVSESTSS